MIPKIIHYCWFGNGQKSEKVKECMKTWKQFLPDYTFYEWNEQNFDIDKVQYTKEAYQNRKWAFVTDYVRLYALYNYGGIYIDTDVEILKPLDAFLDNRAFSGYEANDSPITAVMGAEKGNETIKYLLDYYNDKSFSNEQGDKNIVTNTRIITKMLTDSGLVPNGKEQCINGFRIYPQIMLCPNNFSRIWGKPSPRSYTIHHFEQSWSKTSQKRNILVNIKRYVMGVIRNHIGTNAILRIKGEPLS